MTSARQAALAVNQTMRRSAIAETFSDSVRLYRCMVNVLARKTPSSL
jgi:hypothetical protein